MDLSALDSLDGPHLHVLVGGPGDPWEKVTYPLRDTGKVVRELRGAKMRTLDGLYDEFAAALQFPHYFGENWPAFHECMIELEQLGYDVPGYVVVVRNAGELLADEHTDAFADMLGLLGRIADTWAAPVEEGEWWDRPGRPFHVVLHENGDASDALVARLREADIELGEVWRVGS